MAVSANFGMSINANYSNTDELSTLTDNVALSRGQAFGEGTGANQINLIFHDQRPLAKGASETLDFSDGSLTNKVGQAITLDFIKAIYIKNNVTDARLKIGAATSAQLPVFGTPATDTSYVLPTGEWEIIAPNEDGISCNPDGKLKILYVDEGEGVEEGFLTYDIIVIGVDVPE